MSYRNLQIWQLARELTIDIHRMTLEKLPKSEAYEEAPQIRRSMKSVRSNIVEGYGKRRYKQDFIRFIVYAEASCDETTDHLEMLFETQSLTDNDTYQTLHSKLRTLGKQIHAFLQAVEAGHLALRETHDDYPEQAANET